MRKTSYLKLLYPKTDASRKIAEGKLTENEVNAKPSYATVQEEVAEKRGFSSKGKSVEDLILHEDLVKIMPMVSGANSMARELGKDVHSEIVLVSPQMRGRKDGATEIYVQTTNEDTGIDQKYQI